MYYDTVPKHCRTKNVLKCLLNKYWFCTGDILNEPTYACLLDEEICLDIIKKYFINIIHIPNKFRTLNIAKCVLNLYNCGEYYIDHDDPDEGYMNETLNASYQAYILLRYYDLIQYGLTTITDLLPNNCFEIIYSYLQTSDLLNCKNIHHRCYQQI